MHVIQTPKAPVPAGHYSQAVVHNGLVYVAGQLPHDPDSPGASPGDAAAQTEQTLRNVQAVLEAAGSGLHRILQATVYVTDIGLWGEVNRAWAGVLGDHRPARAVVPVKELHHGYLVEIQVIAAAGEAGGRGGGGRPAGERASSSRGCWREPPAAPPSSRWRRCGRWTSPWTGSRP